MAFEQSNDNSESVVRSERARHAADARPRLCGLAASFADEPELILACLQGLGQESAAQARAILDAACSATEARPEYADLFCHAARAAMTAGEYKTAEIVLAHALELNPTYKDALILAGHVALKQQQLRRAATYLETALSMGADYADVHVLLGDIHCQEGDRTQARTAYERALELNASLTAAHAGLAILGPKEATGKRDELSA